MNIFQKEFFNSPIPEERRYRILLLVWCDLQRQFQEGEISMRDAYERFFPQMEEMDIHFNDWWNFYTTFIDLVKKDGVEGLELENGPTLHIN